MIQRKGPAALKLRPDLIEDVESYLCFRFDGWPWQCMAKMDRKVVCESLQTGKRYRFLAKKEMTLTHRTNNNGRKACYINKIELIR